MNSKDRNMFTEISKSLIEIRTNVKWIKKNVDEHNKKIDKANDSLIIVEQQLKNHLKQHEQSFKKLGLYISIIGITVSLIASIAIKLLLG